MLTAGSDGSRLRVKAVRAASASSFTSTVQPRCCSEVRSSAEVSAKGAHGSTNRAPPEITHAVRITC
jgi:hypothetical protein